MYPNSEDGPFAFNVRFEDAPKVSESFLLVCLSAVRQTPPGSSFVLMHTSGTGSDKGLVLFQGGRVCDGDNESFNLQTEVTALNELLGEGWFTLPIFVNNVTSNLDTNPFLKINNTREWNEFHGNRAGRAVTTALLSSSSI